MMSQVQNFHYISNDNNKNYNNNVDNYDNNNVDNDDNNLPFHMNITLCIQKVLTVGQQLQYTVYLCTYIC